MVVYFCTHIYVAGNKKGTKCQTFIRKKDEFDYCSRHRYQNLKKMKKYEMSEKMQNYIKKYTGSQVVEQKRLVLNIGS